MIHLKVNEDSSSIKYKSLIAFLHNEKIDFTIEPVLNKTDCYTTLRDDIGRMVELYNEKMNSQAEVGGYSTALMYQTKISALEDVLIKMEQSNVV